jgi:hypothetical protein
MQKVVGSSPIIRSMKSPANAGLSLCLGHYAQGASRVFGNEKGTRGPETASACERKKAARSPVLKDEMHPYTILKLAEGHAAGLEREAHRNSLAKAVAESRRDERRNFLRRMWQKRHAHYPHVSAPSIPRAQA